MVQQSWRGREHSRGHHSEWSGRDSRKLCRYRKSRCHGWSLPTTTLRIMRRPRLAGVAQSPFPGVAQFPKDAFAPRFGVAWKPLPTDRLSVRAGFGVFYDRLGYSFTGRSNGAPPYSSLLGNSGSANYAASFAQPYPPGPYSFGWPTSDIRWINLAEWNQLQHQHAGTRGT